MITIKHISDYIIFRLTSESVGGLSTLKHQKLLYYVQAWYLAFYNKELFKEDFQAWIHGPVNREIYDLYKDKKFLYSEMTLEDAIDPEIASKLPNDVKIHVDTILDTYAKFSDVQLERMTHEEFPWLEAREGFKPTQRCENIIKNKTMEKYYAGRLKHEEA